MKNLIPRRKKKKINKSFKINKTTGDKGLPPNFPLPPPAVPHRPTGSPICGC